MSLGPSAAHRAAGGLRLPGVALDVQRAPEPALPEPVMPAPCGTAIASPGCLLPAGWTARVRAVTALRTD
ncbi:hypothetical protein ABZ357_35980 [Streptomyces sp. NPDC005917]|uniref:hypothetical protein n=1 Tax=unclassified Streptomyces TaxID=2593676 RepID=UPI0033D6AAE4